MSSRFAVVAAAFCACVVLAACGGSSPASKSSSAVAKEQVAEQKAETQFDDWARCLRQHGLNAEANGHGLKVMGDPTGGPAGAEAAERACAHLRPNDPGKSNPSPQEKVEQEEHGREFEKCMREHGVKLETQTTGGRALLLVDGRPANPESPAFQRAAKVCGGPKL